MRVFNSKKTALFAAGSLVVLSGGIATTAQASGTTPANDKPICKTWPKGAEWAAERPDGGGWVQGKKDRFHAETFFTEYHFERYVDGPQEFSDWMTDPERPSNDPEDNAWEPWDNKQVIDADAFTDWQFKFKDDDGDEQLVVRAKTEAEARVLLGDALTDEFTQVAKTNRINHPVVQHTEYQFDRLSKVEEYSDWLLESTPAEGWELDETREVSNNDFVDHAWKWTRDRKDCTIKVDICHLKTLVPRAGDPRDGFVLKTIKIDSLEDARFVEGHKFDNGDIIPEFDYLYVKKSDKDGDDFKIKTFTFKGKNLSPATSAFLDNGCWLVPEDVKPPVKPVVEPVVKPVVAPAVTPAAVTPAPVVVEGVEAVTPAFASAGQADTSGQLLAGGLAGLGALFAFGGSVLLRRKSVN